MTVQVEFWQLITLLLSFFPGPCEFHGAHLDAGGYFVALSPP